MGVEGRFELAPPQPPTSRNPPPKLGGEEASVRSGPAGAPQPSGHLHSRSLTSRHDRALTICCTTRSPASGKVLARWSSRICWRRTRSLIKR